MERKRPGQLSPGCFLVDWKRGDDSCYLRFFSAIEHDIVEQIAIDSSRPMGAVKLSPKYQVVIPSDVRESLHLVPGQMMQVNACGNRSSCFQPLRLEKTGPGIPVTDLIYE